MPRPEQADHKVAFSTRVSPGTLRRLDALVEAGIFPNRIAALEAAVDKLAEDANEKRTIRLNAVERTAGGLQMAAPPVSVEDAEADYKAWLYERLIGREPRD
jgi:Arc/MetJ-type ribon-helix-helix transcriptional regulator